VNSHQGRFPLPYPQAERVVQVDRQTKEGPYYGMSLIQFRTYRQQNQSFEYLAAYDILGSGLSLNTGSDDLSVPDCILGVQPR
jgi:hypothetical protein